MLVARHAPRSAFVMLVAVLWVASGCGSEKHASPANLKSRLLPVSELPGFKLYRPFAWRNSIDLVVQGFPLSETTSPSQAVRVADKAGFEAGAGEQLRKGAAPPEITIEAVKLESHKGAERLLSYVHAEGLKLPCYASCSELPSDLPVTGIPEAQGIQQVPQPHPPPGATPFVAYGVGFTIGPYLYLVGGGRPPGIAREELPPRCGQEAVRARAGQLRQSFAADEAAC